MRVPWTARRSNKSILKEINPEYSLEGLMLKLKLQSFGHLMRRASMVLQRVRCDLATEQLYLNFGSVQVIEVGGNEGWFSTETCTHEAGCKRRFIWGKILAQIHISGGCSPSTHPQCLILNGYQALSYCILNDSISAYLFSTSCNTIAA